jgi:DNA-binding winged helix-turn-helix (wHTH) protein
MAERLVHNPSVWGAIGQSERAICERSGRTSSTAITIATQITAEAPSCFSKVGQGHHEAVTENRRVIWPKSSDTRRRGQPDFNLSEGITMRANSNSSRTPDRMDPVFAGAGSTPLASRSAAIRSLDSSTRPGEHRTARRTRMPPTPQNEMAQLFTEIDGLPILVRLLVKDMLAVMQSDFASEGADIHLLLSNTLEKMVHRMRGSSPRRNGRSKQPLAIVEVMPGGAPLVPLPAPPNETMLRVGSLELDLLDRTAKRGDRLIDLRPREFRLLKYMMQQRDKLLTRASLLKEVWHYKFVPETNLVDVHMGRLRRKIDGSNDAPMIRNVRGVGFILSAASLPQDSTRAASETLPI